MTDAELASVIATEAGELLRSIRAESAPCRALGDRGDREANDLILGRLAAARPGEFVLSEESADDRQRCGARRVWIVDPLDGTRDYAEGLDDWAVHVGLALDGVPAIGAVALPMRLRTFASHMPVALPPKRAGRMRMTVSRTRCPAVAERVATTLDAALVPMGSAGAKAMAVLEGRADIYLHAGGQYEWDNCAPAAVAIAAGLHVSRIDGSPLAYNCADPLLPDLLICRPELADDVLAAVRQA